MITTVITIIAIHGNGGGGFRFDRMQPHIPEDVRFVAPTLPGFADAPADPNLKTMRDYATYIHGWVKAEQAPVVLLGTGIGGSFLLEYIQHYTAAGVIFHAPVGTRLDSRRFPWLMKLPGMRGLGKTMIASPLTRGMFKRLLFVDHHAIPGDYLNRFFDEYRQCAVFGQMFDIITADWYNALQPVNIPAALLWGADERVLSAKHIQDYQQLLPQSTVRVVDGWDHFPMIEQPIAYAAEVVALARQLVPQTINHAEK